MDSHVTAVDLHIRAPASMCAEAPRAAESFARRVLERCEARLSARQPGAIFIVRELDVSLRLFDRALDDDVEIDAVADAIADHIHTHATAVTVLDDADGGGGGEVAVFESETEWRARHLEAWAHGAGGAGWRFAPLVAEGEPLATLTTPAHRERLHAMLLALHRRDALERTMSALSPALVRATARTLGVDGRHGSDAVHGDDTTAPPASALAAIAGRVLTSATAPEPVTYNDASFCAQPSARYSRCANAVYLVNVLLDLSLGEILWRACLPEGRVLAHALADMFPPGDPIVAALFGVDSGEPLPALSLEQHDEAARALLESLVEALARRKIARRPTVAWSAIEAPVGGRSFVASSADEGDVLFAMPAPTAHQRQEAVSTFSAVWPTAPSRATATTPPRIAGHESSRWSALLSQIAGSVALLFAARAGQRYVPAPGEVVVTTERTEVRLPMDAIDLDIRRAGLDRDPGGIPWLRRHVVITFVGPDDGTDESW